MTIAVDGWQTYLAEDVSATDTTFVLGFDDDMPTLPFDFTIGLERVRVTGHPATNTIEVERGINGTPADSYFGGSTAGIAEARTQYLVYHGASLFCDLTAIIENCPVDWSMPGGEMQAVASFRTYDPARYFPDPDARLVISSNESGTFIPSFSGLLTIPAETRLDDGSYAYELVFHGMNDTLGENGDIYIDTIKPVAGYYDSGHGWWAAFTPIHQVVTDAVRDLASAFVSLDFGHVVDGGQQIGKEFNGQWKSPLAIINEMCAGGDTGEALDWAVFTDPDGGAKLWLYRRGRWPTVNIPWGSVKLPATVPFSWDRRAQKNRVAVKYGSGTALATDPLAGRLKTTGRDVSSTIQDMFTGQNIADSVLSGAKLLQTTTEKGITLEYKADDPSTLYLTDSSGSEIALWRGSSIVGRMARFPDLSATNARWPITPMQIKTYHWDPARATGQCQFGKYVDWLAAFTQYSYQEAQRPDSAVHSPAPNNGLANAPQFQNPYGAVTSNIPQSDIHSGTIGTHQVQKDLDMAPPQWTYDDPTGTPLPAGWYGDYAVHANGHILAFAFRGTDGTQNPTSGVFEIWKGHDGGAPTLAATITVAGAIIGGYTYPDATILDVVPGDYLRLRILTNDATTGFAHIAVSAQLRRTGGSDRPTSTAGATIMGVSHASDPDTGVVTFTITADRPVHGWVEYGVFGDTYRSVTGVTSDLSKTPKPGTYAIPAGVTMHGRALVMTADEIITTGEDFLF